MVKAIVRREVVTLDRGVWAGASPSLLEKLEAVTLEAVLTVGGSDPSPELTVAEYACAELAGRVVDYIADEDKTKGRIF